MHVYFAYCLHTIKVGLARDVKSRLKQLRSSSGSPLTLLGTVKGDRQLERNIHKKLARHRIKGEWYRDCDEVRATIQLALNNFDLSDGNRQKTDIFGRVCKAIWPIKTAEALAAAVGCAVRTAAYEISGEREPSARSVSVIVDLMTRRP